MYFTVRMWKKQIIVTRKSRVNIDLLIADFLVPRADVLVPRADVIVPRVDVIVLWRHCSQGWRPCAQGWHNYAQSWRFLCPGLTSLCSELTFYLLRSHSGAVHPAEGVRSDTGVRSRRSCRHPSPEHHAFPGGQRFLHIARTFHLRQHPSRKQRLTRITYHVSSRRHQVCLARAAQCPVWGSQAFNVWDSLLLSILCRIKHFNH